MREIHITQSPEQGFDITAEGYEQLEDIQGALWRAQLVVEAEVKRLHETQEGRYGTNNQTLAWTNQGSQSDN